MATKEIKTRKLPPRRKNHIKSHLACPRCGKEIRVDVKLSTSRRQRGGK